MFIYKKTFLASGHRKEKQYVIFVNGNYPFYGELPRGISSCLTKFIIYYCNLLSTILEKYGIIKCGT